MKASCSSKNIKDVIQSTEKIASRNQSTPILNSIKITAIKNKLCFLSTNLETGIEMCIPASILNEGDVAVPSGIVSNFISSLPLNSTITLENQNNNLEITTQTSSTIIKGHSVQDFPDFPKLKSKQKFDISINDLLAGLRSVVYSASLSEIKPEIASVLVYPRENGIVFVATDSFRLAEKYIQLKQNVSFSKILIPHRSVSEILRIFDKKGGVLNVSYDENQILFVFEHIKLITRIVDGVFPDYKQIIPSKFVTDVVVSRDMLMNAIKTAAIFSNKLYEITITVGGKKNILTLQTSGGDGGEHTAYVNGKVTGIDIATTLNYHYIMESLPHINSNDVILRFPDKKGPIVITGMYDSSFQYLVMPMTS